MSETTEELETRSAAKRATDLARELPRQIALAQSLPGNGALGEVDAESVTDASSLASLPVLRKSDLMSAQSANPPLGGYAPSLDRFTHVFQSPGPIYEPGRVDGDWFRLGRFLRACGIGTGDVVQNCFGYHLTPAGMMFESGARAVGATVLPAGTGQTELQARAAAQAGATAYAGTPDYRKPILESADAHELKLNITRPSLRATA